MLRGNAKQTIFYDEDDIRRFEEILSQGLERYTLRLCAYCWMKNHVHMALQVSDIPLFKIMQSLSQRYTVWFNHRYDRVGHLFQGRYKAILVDREGYLREIIRYIHLNPVRADLVADPLDYPDSSHHAYLAPDKAPQWLSIDPGLKLFGHTKEAALAGYLYFMGQPIESKHLELLRKGGKQGHILGDDNFVNKALNQVGEQPASDISLDALTDLVAEKYNIIRQDLISKSRSKPVVEARAVIALLAVECTRHTLKDVSLYLEREISNMSRQVKKLREKAKKFSTVQNKIKGLVEELTAMPWRAQQNMKDNGQNSKRFDHL
jgi:REP element-mobilizing transposase RayT